MAKVILARDWYFQNQLFRATRTGVEIPGLEAYAKAYDKKVEEILPKGAKLADPNATILPETHQTVTTLSELAKRPAVSAVEAVSGSKGPEVIIDDGAKNPAPLPKGK